jgi:F-type H+-transporting ATPase subunit alpha
MVPVSEQIASLVAVTQGVLDRVPVERIAEAEIRIRSEARRRLPDILTAIAGGAKLDEHQQGELRRVAEEAVLELVEEEPDDLRA